MASKPRRSQPVFAEKDRAKIESQCRKLGFEPTNELFIKSLHQGEYLPYPSLEGLEAPYNSLKPQKIYVDNRKNRVKVFKSANGHNFHFQADLFHQINRRISPYPSLEGLLAAEPI